MRLGAFISEVQGNMAAFGTAQWTFSSALLQRNLAA